MLLPVLKHAYVSAWERSDVVQMHLLWERRKRRLPCDSTNASVDLVKRRRIADTDTNPSAAWTYHHPTKSQAALDDAALLLGCFVVLLPLQRIRDPLPATAYRDGHKIMKNYGMKFLRFVDSRRSATELGQPQTSLVEYYEALWHFFRKKLSNAHSRCGLVPAPGESYVLNDFRWRGFWVTEEEFDRACRGAVADFSMARYDLYDR